MPINSYRDLDAWQLAMQLAEDTYRATKLFPRTETYGLASQLQRAAISIPSNVAEGHARRSKADFARFLGMALGSTAEVETQLLLARRFDYLDAPTGDRLLNQANRVGRVLRGLRTKVSVPTS